MNDLTVGVQNKYSEGCEWVGHQLFVDIEPGDQLTGPERLDLARTVKRCVERWVKENVLP